MQSGQNSWNSEVERGLVKGVGQEDKKVSNHACGDIDSLHMKTANGESVEDCEYRELAGIANLK